MKISDVLKNDKKIHFEHGSKGHSLLNHYYSHASAEMLRERKIGTYWASFGALLQFGSPEEWAELFDRAIAEAEIDERAPR